MATIDDPRTPGRAPDVERFGPRWAPTRFERATDGPRVILVGVDGSETSMRAAAYACGLARRQRCEVVVAYAIPDWSFRWAIPGASAVLVTTLEEMEADLRAEIRRMAEDAQVPVGFVSRRTNPYTCLRGIAEEIKADAIVVGASCRMHRVLGGSIAARLIRLGHWPVTVIP